MMTASISAVHALLKSKGANPFLLASRNPVETCLRFGSLFHHRSSMPKEVRNVDDAFIMFNELIQRRPLPSVVKFTQLLNVVTRMKHFAASIDLFNQMCAVGVPADECLMNIAIKCCCQLHRTNEGFAVLSWNFKRGIIPDACTWSALLNGLILEDRIVDAERLFNKLTELKINEPRILTSNMTMIRELREFGNDLINLMVESGKVPNIMTYNSVIDGYCMKREVIKAREIFDSMASKNLVPSIITYNSLLYGHCNNYQIEKVMDVFDEIIRKGLKPNVITYDIMLHGLLRAGLYTNHHDVDGYLLRTDAKLDDNIGVYTSLIDGAIKCDKLDIAKFIFHELYINGLQPDVQTRDVMINGFGMEGVLQLFVEMDERGFPRNNVTYLVLVHERLKYQHYDDVERLLEEMDGRGYYLDHYTIWLLLRDIPEGSQYKSIWKLVLKLLPKECTDVKIVLKEYTE